MSRVGRNPIDLPPKVKFSIESNQVTVEGSKGKLSQTIPSELTLKVEDGKVIVMRSSDDRRSRALHGLYRSLISNMVSGVTIGFQKELRLVGLGYRAQTQGSDSLVLSLGFSHQITYKAPSGITLSVGSSETRQIHGESQPEIPIIVSGIDKYLVGEVAATIRRLKKPEPYKGKGIRYAGERVRVKVGKAAG